MKIEEQFKITHGVICPHCGKENEKEYRHKQDMSLYGKAVFNCTGCDKLFTLADDGDGEYVHIPRSQNL